MIAEIREHIGDMGDASNEVLQRAQLPAELEDADGNTCLAEQLVEGTQSELEGTMFRGEFNVHGVFDMHKDEAGTRFSRLGCPASSVPESVQQQMIDLSERYLCQPGYDNGCFNSDSRRRATTRAIWSSAAALAPARGRRPLAAVISDASRASSARWRARADRDPCPPPLAQQPDR